MTQRLRRVRWRLDPMGHVYDRFAKPQRTIYHHAALKWVRHAAR